jgi:WD repeat-containing protein 23
VYSGSEDGKVYVWNLDATIAAVIDVNEATFETRPFDPDLNESSYYHRTNINTWKTLVRDASWHPNAPIIAATSWTGWGMTTGACTTHSWNDETKKDEYEGGMATRVNGELKHDPRLYEKNATTRNTPRGNWVNLVGGRMAFGLGRY